MLGHVLVRRPADLDPARDDFRRPASARPPAARRRRPTIAVGMPERAWAVAIPAPITPEPITPTRWIGASLDPSGRSTTPGSRELRFCRKNTAIRFAEIGEPITSRAASSARPSGPRRAGRLHAFSDRLEGDQGRGIIPLRLHPDRPFGVAKAKAICVGAEAERPLAGLLAIRAFHSSGLAATIQSMRRTPSSIEPVGGDGVEGEAPRSTAFWWRRSGSPEQISSIAFQADQSGQSLGAAPAGDDAELGLRAGRSWSGEPIAETIRSSIGKDQLGPAAHAVAVDEGDRRERQAPTHPEELVAEADGLGRRCSFVGERERRRARSGPPRR